MPRASKTEQKIINLMDEYAFCLVQILQFDIEIFKAIEFLNEDIEEALIKNGFAKESEGFLFEDARTCVVALYICGGMDKVYNSKDSSQTTWLALSSISKRFNIDTIELLNGISSSLLDSYNLIPALSEIITLSNLIEVSSLIRIINLIERPFSPLDILNNCCLAEIFQTRWTSKGEFEGDDIAIYRLLIEKEFINISGFSFNKSVTQSSLIDSATYDLCIDGVRLDNTSALLFPNVPQKFIDNPEYIDEFEKLLHQMISFKLQKPIVESLRSFDSYLDMINYSAPEESYKRGVVSHKGSIIGLFGAIYAQLLYKVEKVSVVAAIKDSSTLISNLGFYCTESTITRVRKEHLSILKVNGKFKIKVAN